jgi:hypothetical protein
MKQQRYARNADEKNQAVSSGVARDDEHLQLKRETSLGQHPVTPGSFHKQQVVL